MDAQFHSSEIKCFLIISNKLVSIPIFKRKQLYNPVPTFILTTFCFDEMILSYNSQDGAWTSSLFTFDWTYYFLKWLLL